MVPCGPLLRSITGVAVTPISGTIWLQWRLSDGVSPGLSIEACHSFVPASASKANTESCSVATNTTLWLPAPGIARLETYSGCASTLPSTGMAKSLPNEFAFTLLGVSVLSVRFWPVRALSLCQVSTSVADDAGGGVGVGDGPGPAGGAPAVPAPLEPPLPAHRTSRSPCKKSRQHSPLSRNPKL